MGFDVNRFQSASLEHRQKKVLLPLLKDFFSEGEEPEWTVRGLSGPELGYVRETIRRNKDVGDILDGLASGKSAEKVQAVKELFGLAGKVTDETATWLETVVQGSVDPKIDMETAVKLCEFYAVHFTTLALTIQSLTGQGADAKKKP